MFNTLCQLLAHITHLLTLWTISIFGRMRSPRRLAARAIVRVTIPVALVALLLLPAAAFAHPLGNFSVNRYARVELQPGQATVLYIVDMAEIPTLQAHSQAGLDPDNAAAVEAYRLQEAAELAANLALTINNRPVRLDLIGSEIEFPAGQADLLTQRLTLHLGTPSDAVSAAGMLRFEDANYAGRIGWQELIVQPGEGMQLLESNVAQADLSNELRNYPADFRQKPQQVEAARVQFATVDAGTNTAQIARAGVGGADNGASSEAGFAALVAIPALTPVTILLALLAAFGWGAAHAMSPGHGKTIVGAYLVGSRGTSRHAVFLGLTTTVTHTAGVFILGLITLFASNYILPGTLFPWLSLFSGLSVVIIGLIMGRNYYLQRANHGHDHHSHHHHSHHHHSHHHHSHHHHDHDGGHTHAPPGADGSPITWRSLLALGISGGLLPCPSALVVMLSAIALGRVGFGLLLIIVFSLGLAGVLTAVGIAMIHAGKLFDRVPSSSRTLQLLPVLSALFITLAGIGITWQALTIIL